MHSVVMLKNEDFMHALQQAIKRTESHVYIISAFLKADIMDWLASIIPSNVGVRILTRWRPADLMAGASDLSAYYVARNRGWALFVDDMVHAKTILIDDSCLFVGSANLTSSGTHFLGFGNNELTVQFKPGFGDVEVVSGFFDSALRVTKPLVRLMEEFLATLESAEESLSWPLEIENCFRGQVESLWLDECFRTGPDRFFCSQVDDPDISHDVSIFGSRLPTKIEFQRTRLHGWLVYQFTLRPNEVLSFGFLSRSLHSSILDEDVPFRKEIKVFLDNLFKWVEYFDIFEVVEFNRSKGLRSLDG